MDKVPSQASDELAKVVWASHILSYLNRHTATVYSPSADAASDTSGASDAGDDEDDGEEEEVDVDVTSNNAEPLTASDDLIREKFLNCVAELLAHTKGGAYVTATALREGEESVEVDVARNNGHTDKDADYVSGLAKFLALRLGKHLFMYSSHHRPVSGVEDTAK